MARFISGSGRGISAGAVPAGVFEGRYLKSLQKAELSFCSGAASFLQSDFWGRFKSRFGWEALAFRAVWDAGQGAGPGGEGGREKPLLALRRRLAAGFSLAYVPWGPELPPDFSVPEEASGGRPEDLAAARNAALKELAAALKKTLPRDTVFIRFDPPWYREASDALPAEPPPPFVRSGADIQPPDTALVNLNQPMESILNGMKPKWRYNARLALKKGVAIRRAGGEEIGAFYDLLKETARRDGIAIHGPEYYRALFEEGGRASGAVPDLRLYFAEHEGEALAGIVTLFRGNEAVYLYGASSDKKRNFMAPNALQIKAMEDARASGCGQYDLFGIPPNAGDPSHPMAGLYQFKTGFGGRIIHRPGSWDYPCRPFIYRLFRRAETLRKYLMSMKKKSRRRASAQ